MTTSPGPAGLTVPDTEVKGLLAWFPRGARPYALLARFDRPIGWWLLFWPCAFAVALAGGAINRWPLILWMLVGAIAMRGAGCVYNDIVDRDLDAQVARTAGRPIASGVVSLKAAWIWLAALSLVGLIVLLQLHWRAQLVALGSLALVAAYPFMKRITWWPQAWLGLVFTWGALVGWVEMTGEMNAAGLLLYAGGLFWTIGYDTIYALQDKEDDALVGIRSSALAMGSHVREGVGLCYGFALVLWGCAFWMTARMPLALVALLPLAVHFLWQVAFLKQDGADPLAKFRSNRFAGLLMFAACLTVGSA